MGSMFELAASFSSDLYEWGNRFSLIGSSISSVNVANMFVHSACTIDLSPVNFEEGPWCTEVYETTLSDSFQ
jgi:hypothetical protein